MGSTPRLRAFDSEWIHSAADARADERRAPTIENTRNATFHQSPSESASFPFQRAAGATAATASQDATSAGLCQAFPRKPLARFVQRRFEEESRSAAGSGRARPEEAPAMTTTLGSHSDSHPQPQHRHWQQQLLQRPPTMPATTSTSASAPASSAPSPLSVQRPALSPRKRKFSDAGEAASPTSLDEVATSSSSSSSSPLEERVISPKKKARAEERGDLSKWESHVVASIASALDLGCMDDDSKEVCGEPIAFGATPAGDLAADELEILRHFLA